MGDFKFNSLISPINKGNFLQWENFFGSTTWLYIGKEVLQRRKDFTKSSYKFEKWQKCYTCNLCLSTSSFRNKPLMTLDWYLKSRKGFHCCLSNYDKGKKIIKKYYFVKKIYYHNDCIPIIINFNKIYVRIIFL